MAWLGASSAWYRQHYSCPKILAIATRLQRPPSGGCFYLLSFVGSPVNGSIYSFILSCSASLSSCNWFTMYFFIASLFLPTVSTYPPTPEMPVPVFIFQISKLVKYHQTAFPLQYTHKFWYALFRRYRYKHMYMVFTRICFYFYPIASFAYTS